VWMVQPAVAGEQFERTASLLLFRLDGRTCAIATSCVVEVLAAVAVRPLPGQPGYIAGVIDVRGEIVPVLDLRVRFGGTARPMELSDRFIIVRARGRLLVLWVDDVEALTPSDGLPWSAAEGLVTGDSSLAGVTSTVDGPASIHDIDAFVEQCEADAVYASAGA
jgi:purine-binding chemotaxis protein CheW